MKDKVAEVAFYTMIWIVGVCMILSMTKDLAHTISMLGTLIDINIWAAVVATVYWMMSGKNVFKL